MRTDKMLTNPLFYTIIGLFLPIQINSRSQIQVLSNPKANCQPRGLNDNPFDFSYNKNRKSSKLTSFSLSLDLLIRLIENVFVNFSEREIIIDSNENSFYSFTFRRIVIEPVILCLNIRHANNLLRFLTNKNSFLGHLRDLHWKC